MSEGLGAGVQLEPLDWVESGSSVQRDRGLVARCDHHVGGVLPPPADLREEPLHQKRSRPAPPHDRIDGDGQQLRTLAGTTGAVAKGLHDPAPRSEQPASHRRARQLRRHATRRPDRGRPHRWSRRGIPRWSRRLSTMSRKDPGARTTRRYSLRRNLGPRMVKNPSPICPAWRAAAAAASPSVPVRSTMPFCVFESIAFAVASERLRTPAVAGHLVTIGDATAMTSW